MATLTDRPRPTEKPSVPEPGPPAPRERPIAPARVRRTDQLRALLYLFGPLGLALVAFVALIAVVVALIVGGGETGPATGAARLVPGNALVYVHVSTDPARPAVRRLLALGRPLPDFPLLRAAVIERLDTILSGSPTAGVDFATQVRPWLGKEAALAVLDTTTSTAGSLIVLDVRSRSEARAFLDSVGASPDGRFRGVALLRQPSGTELAFVDHYLVLGQKSSVESAIYVEAGKAPSLATTPSYENVAGQESSDRVLDAYASAAGIQRALVPRTGLLGGLGVLLDQPALSATTISVSPAAHGLELTVYSALDSELAHRLRLNPVQFSPTLVDALPASSTLLFDVANLPRAASRLLSAAATVGVAGRFGTLLSRLGSGLATEGVDVHTVLKTFSGETAVAVVPTRNGSSAPVVLTRTSHPAATRAQLANLETPLTQLFTPPGSGPGVIPEENDVGRAGTSVHELALAPGFQLDYAVHDGLVLISTSPDAIARVLAHTRSLTGDSAYAATLGNHPGQVTSLLFSALPELLRLGEQTGLIDASRLATVWPDLAKVRAVGLQSTSAGLDTTTELSLQIR